MSDYAQVVITTINEQAKTTIKHAKVVAKEREQESQSQWNILKAISKIVGQQRQEVASQPTRKLFIELRGQHPKNFSRSRWISPLTYIS